MRNMAISISLTKRLGIEHSVMLAPMGFVSGGALAAAVSAGGGLWISVAVTQTRIGWSVNSLWPATALSVVAL
jgi:NAD(P)H-dependent flavin oxidoreductase YrpB (nitropropane dioxygenase family)